MLITNFSSGELSPTLNGRVDLQQYYQGAGHIENFDIIPTGGIRRRVGSQRLHDTSGSNRLIPFIINKDLSFILELGEYSIEVWKMTGNVFSSIQNIVTEYLASEIHQIHYAQNYNTLVMVHRNHAPVQLVFNGSSFTYGEMTFDFTPDINLDDDFDYIMLPDPGDPDTCLPEYKETSNNKWIFEYTKDESTVKKSFATDTGAYCILNGHLYKFSSIVSGWKIEGEDPAEEAGLFTSEGNYPGVVSFFNNRLYFGSTKNNPQKIWASMAPDTENNRYNKFATYQKYITVNNAVKDADLHVFSCSIAKNDASTNQTIIRNVSQDFTKAGFLKKAITEYYVTGTYFPQGTKVKSCTATTITVDKKSTVDKDYNNITNAIQLWISSETVTAEDYEYVVVNNNITTADCSFNFELASDENDAIMFLSSGKYLAAGTESSIWSIDPQSNAVQISAVMQGRYGSDEIQGLAVASAQIYFAQGCRGIREFYYDSAAEAFQTNNIAILAEHLLEESPVVDFDYCSNPYNRLFVLRNDGTIAILLYDKNNNVMGWSRYTRTKGKITNIAITRGNAQYDLIYLFIEEGNNSYIELIDCSKKVYLDSWQVFNKTTRSTAGYTSGAILYNATTKKECDAFNIPVEFITSKSDEVYIGYKYESDIVSLPVLTNDTTGKKRIAALLVRLLNSELPVMVCGEKQETFSGKEAPYSGIIQMTYPGNYDRDVTFEIKTDIPEEVTILSVNAQIAE